VKILTAAETRDVDRLTTERAGVPSLTLMENAGKSVAEFAAARFSPLAQRKILVLCGKGNNGGDGFVSARHLLAMGANPTVFLFADPKEVKGDAAANLARYQQAGGRVVAIPDASPLDSSTMDFSDSTFVIDALLGTGVRGAVEGLLRRAIDAVNARPPECVALSIDIPSGLHADTGEACGAAISADYTVTFTAPKRGFFYASGADRAGRVVVRQIGSPGELIEEVGQSQLRWSEPSEFRRFAVPRRVEGHKGDYGHALIVAGSMGKTGAAVLASWAALRAGAGLVTVATPEPALPIVAAHAPEVMTVPLASTLTGAISEASLAGNAFADLLAGKRALALGPGLSTHPETQSFVRQVVARHRDVPLVLDADGLNAFAGRASELKRPGASLVVTPHPGEMARLLGCSIAQVQQRRVEVASKAAADWNVHVVLKGHETIVASPAGSAYVNSTGNPGMGTGGTGDALTGILAALTAQFGTNDWNRVLAFGVYLHGLAGDIAFEDAGEAPLMASDLIRKIPDAYRRFYSGCRRA
jgi:ADP-dependent NAD(P)H-hydrate dehydratase / NAD(P)H-hydrate epimerase